MKIKKIVVILFGIMLIAFGIGLLSLKHYGFSNKSNNLNINFSFAISDFVKSFKDVTSDYVEKNIDEEKIENIDGINTLDIDVSFSNVNIIAENRDDVKIHYHGYIKANFIPKLKTKTSNSTLYIKLEKGSDKSYNTETVDVKLDIYVPKSYEKSIKANTSFGNINISNLNLSHLKLITSFGNIEIRNLKGDVEADTSYGNIVIQNLSGDLTASTSFGNIDLEYQDFDYNIKADTSFGDIKLALPKNSQFKIEAECSLGDIDIDFPVKITKNERDKISGTVGSSSNSIDLETSSGDIKVISR